MDGQIAEKQQNKNMYDGIEALHDDSRDRCRS